MSTPTYSEMLNLIGDLVHRGHLWNVERIVPFDVCGTIQEAVEYHRARLLVRVIFDLRIVGSVGIFYRCRGGGAPCRIFAGDDGWQIESYEYCPHPIGDALLGIKR